MIADGIPRLLHEPGKCGHRIVTAIEADDDRGLCGIAHPPGPGCRASCLKLHNGRKEIVSERPADEDGPNQSRSTVAQLHAVDAAESASQPGKSLVCPIAGEDDGKQCTFR